MEDDRLVLRSITDEIMYELMRLSGQEYVDVYASTMKERLTMARRSRTAATASAGIRTGTSVGAAASTTVDDAAPNPVGSAGGTPAPGTASGGDDAEPGLPAAG
jgi:1-acyl-sn-glycerol-3-phosphate acyltransferase